ncbi:nitrate reductase [Aurantimonas sp. HBX-1]|uniref:nitrate reductase n=1 Tax=Aurantimonas sp. HBX-1 TaxID=2906072 RepID=UPI001F3E699B|nr:nitrate reductase [Aurantimonas sp. HBX-1]UIJ72225.1 nitrate reductase [Aurantimonas sp. HBX-1]
MNVAPTAPPTRTTCPYCGVGCGVLAAPRPDGSVAIAGDPEHPANFGRLCSKGSALGETLGPEARLLRPAIGGRPASWDAAVGLIADRFAATIADHGPDSVAIYGSGQLLTEDYYVANKLMKGFLGSANIDTNSRLCMASSVAGHQRAFGADTVPGTYEDLEAADLLVLVGSNLAWCHPVLFQRIAAARAARPQMRIVVVDPRRTATCSIADWHLPIRADGDTALFCGLLSHLARAGALDAAFVAEHTEGLAEALAGAAIDEATLAASTGLAPADIGRFFDLFAATPKVVTVYSQGVNQSASGTDKVGAIVNCHLATGRIGRPGMGPFSVTGQPNAMGGREVGGMANMLAAHMDLADPDHRRIVGSFWQAPNLATRPGLKAVELFKAVHDGRIKALWILGTNPVVSMPDAGRVREALGRCPFVVVSDIVEGTDTLPFAHVTLPALGWGEKDGTVTNSERRISRQRAFLAPPGEARPDWWALAAVARRMGFDAGFDHDGPAAIFDEHARLSGVGNDGRRDFDISGLAGLGAAGYAALAPTRWPVRADGGTTERFFGDGRFFTPDGRARLVAITPAAPIAAPFVLNTGRVRDHWHTMTRTGRSPRLSAHIAEPFVEIHPADAEAHGIADADLATVTTAHGSAVLRALVTDRQARGALFAPMHWTEEFAPAGRIGPLVHPARDPHSGQPALKATAAALARFPARWHGFAVLRARPDPRLADYVAMARTEGGWRVELAGRGEADPASLACALIGPDTVVREDRRTGAHGFAAFEEGRLAGALWLARGPVAVSRAFACSLLTAAPFEPRARAGILAGRPGNGRPDPGAIVCSCFAVGCNDIARAVAAGAGSVAEIGARLGAGTNCGSCRGEIQAIVDAAGVPADA